VIHKPDNNIEGVCSIGRADECGVTGCKWKLVFGQYCWDRRIEQREKTVVEYKPPVRFVPAEDTKPFYSKRKKKKKLKKGFYKLVKDEKKYTEVDLFAPPPVPLKIEEKDLSKKIKTAPQEDWIKKIKTDENKSW
jgi:hypothetical protein